MNYKIKIEGQEINMPEEIAGNDDVLKSALSPYFPGAANAKYMRSKEKDGVITVTVVKQAGTKGATPSSINIVLKKSEEKSKALSFLDANLPVSVEDQVLRMLIDAPEGLNPLMVLDQKLSSSPAMNQCPFETMLKRDAEISKALEIGEAEVSSMEKTFRSLVETKPKPAPMLTAGF